MTPLFGRWLAGWSLSVVVALSGGCIVAADFLDPTFAASLGFAGFVAPSRGTVIVRFQNDTTAELVATAIVSDNNASQFGNATFIGGFSIDAGDSFSRVVDCPVGVITPGGITGFVNEIVERDFIANGVVGLAFNDPTMPAAFVNVLYGGAPLIAGTDFNCGDVILIRFQDFGAVGADGALANDIRVSIQVFPGR